MRDESANSTVLRRPGRASKREVRNIAIVLCEGFTAFELGVVCEIFGDDLRWVAPGEPWYRLFICAENSASVTSDSGFQISLPYGLEAFDGVEIALPRTFR